MNKYDFGYEIQEGTTTKWAYDIVADGSKVLEFGPAIGNLTRHLHEEKRCVVDIVEIDEESGKNAAKYANKSLLGADEGNAESLQWKQVLDGERYDYIIALDVLEHLKNPETVLNRAKELLNEEGRILISVPNIAHNSVLINILDNKFDYTDVGLLDNTHVHFFTYESLCQMIQNIGCVVVEKDAIQKNVGENEIGNSYQDVPSNIEFFLRTREMADVYQFLFQVKKASNECIDNREQNKYTNLKKTLLPVRVYTKKDSASYMEFYVDSSNIEIEVVIPYDEVIDYLRIDPIPYPGVLTRMTVSVVSNDSIHNLKVISTSGYLCDQDGIVFPEESPWIEYKAEKVCGTIVIKCHYDILDSMSLELIKEMSLVNMKLTNENNEFERENAELKRFVEWIRNERLGRFFLKKYIKNNPNFLEGEGMWKK